jgi:2-polyprenyl-6-methoxyphenol hydroxylase-like FAD-dependent oxidoreductase
LEHPALGPSGWEPGYCFYQPTVERALDRTVRSLPAATVEYGWTAEALTQADDHVELTLRRVRERRVGVLEPTAQTRSVRARYVIGADGANSFVRQAAGIPFRDQGFAASWLVVDLRPDDIEALSHLPAPCQWCDPARPHMHTRNGRSHRRFEFMLLPGERPEDFADRARIWPLLEPWFTPEDGTVVRHAVYEFRARLADSMHAGRVLLAGDAAHTMPPFMGQGLCSGVRDAAGASWRLDLILRGVAGGELLESYTRERRPQNEWIVNLSTEMGRVSCTLDPQVAAERDAALRAAAAPPPLALPPLGDGAVAPGRPLAGTRALQGTIRAAGREGRFYDVVGRRFVLLARRADDLPAAHEAFPARLGALAVGLDEIDDLDGRLTGWLDEHGVSAVLIRPDGYVFGAVEATEDLPELLAQLRAHLSITDTRIPAHVV